jgi:hypothetical protein
LVNKLIRENKEIALGNEMTEKEKRKELENHKN